MRLRRRGALGPALGLRHTTLACPAFPAQAGELTLPPHSPKPQFLTAKPVIYLVNLSEKDYARKKNK